VPIKPFRTWAAHDVGTKSVRNVSQMVASQIGSATSGIVDTGSELASSAREHAKTFASELEGMARRNPLGTIAGALVVGVIIGMISRGRCSLRCWGRSARISTGRSAGRKTRSRVKLATR
jgi:hypothetical protein